MLGIAGGRLSDEVTSDLHCSGGVCFRNHERPSSRGTGRLEPSCTYERSSTVHTRKYWVVSEEFKRNNCVSGVRDRKLRARTGSRLEGEGCQLP